MKIKFKNLWKALLEQGPFKRAWRNFVITGNAWGMFSELSHTMASGKDKVFFSTKEKGLKVAEKMKKKHGKHFSVYKCVYCDGYHLGKNRDNK